MGMIISLIGPFGSGKGYIKDRLQEKLPSLYQPPWITTRKIRIDEVERGDRIHVSLPNFLFLKIQRKITLIDRVGSILYAMRKKDLDWSSRFILTEFSMGNFFKATRRNIPVYSVALIPDSIAFLEKRLEQRGTESQEEIKRRLHIAKKRLEEMLRYRASFSLVCSVSSETENGIAEKIIHFVYPLVSQERSDICH